MTFRDQAGRREEIELHKRGPVLPANRSVQVGALFETLRRFLHFQNLVVAVLRLKHTNKSEFFLQIIFVVSDSFEKEVTF